MAEAGPVLVSGATGLVGGRLVAALQSDGQPVRALTRDPLRAARRLGPRVEPVAWDGLNVPASAAAGASAVVHLAGEPVFAGRLGPRRRARIYESRVASTRSLVSVLKELPDPERPGVLACASAVGFYGSRGEEELDEHAAPGQGFLARLCRDWEAAAAGAEEGGVRVASLRIGIVLAREGGALPRLALVFRCGAGGRIGSGRQWFPWIHVEDCAALIRAVLSDGTYRGPVNAVAPRAVRNEELARALGEILHRPAPWRVPAWAVRTALGELADELLGSRRVVPKCALERGFAFAWPEIKPALARELGRNAG